LVTFSPCEVLSSQYSFYCIRNPLSLNPPLSSLAVLVWVARPVDACCVLTCMFFHFHVYKEIINSIFVFADVCATLPLCTFFVKKVARLVGWWLVLLVA